MYCVWWVGMWGLVELLHARSWPRVAALALMTIGVAACSGELSRLNEGPFAATSSPDATGSIAQTQAAPAARVESDAPPAQAGRGKGGSASSPRPSATVGAEAAAPAPARPASAKWSWDGGTAVTVARGETLDSIARRHGVPASAIMEANNITAPASIRPGQRLVIPRYRQAPAGTAASPAPHVAPNSGAPAGAAGSPGVHVVAAGETLGKISRLYGKQ